MDTRSKVAASLFLIAALSGAVATADAGEPIIGTSMGITYYKPERGSGLLTVAAPNSSLLLATFSPALRIGGFVGENRQHEVYTDLALLYGGAGGGFIGSGQAMLAYQYSFRPERTTPFINVGAGFMISGGTGFSEVNPVVGAGFGVRQELGHGYGAVRTEVRVDRQFAADNSYYASVPDMTAFGLRLGFDLYLD